MKIYESKKYPFVNLDIEIDDFSIILNGYADTGAESHGVFISEIYLDYSKIKQDCVIVDVETADGKVHRWESYLAKVTIGNQGFITTIVITKGTDEIVIGRGLLDQFETIFNGPKKKLILNSI